MHRAVCWSRTAHSDLSKAQIPLPRRPAGTPPLAVEARVVLEVHPRFPHRIVRFVISATLDTVVLIHRYAVMKRCGFMTGEASLVGRDEGVTQHEPRCLATVDAMNVSAEDTSSEAARNKCMRPRPPIFAPRTQRRGKTHNPCVFIRVCGL